MKKILITLSLIVGFFACDEMPKHVKEANRIMKNFTISMENCEQFQLSSFGGELMDDIKKIILTYRGERAVEISEAREIFLLNIKKLLNLINEDTGVRPYLHNYPFTIENVNLSLSFSNPKKEFFQVKYVSYVFCVRGTIFYCNYDLNHKLQTLFEEPYEEALKIVN